MQIRVFAHIRNVFFFVFIHPYMDGNGRMGRFILNVMLASGGYNWTVIPVERRQEYMKALEKTSVEGDISDFTKVIASLEIGILIQGGRCVCVYYFFSEEKRFLYSAGAESHRLSVYLHNISHAKD